MHSVRRRTGLGFSGIATVIALAGMPGSSCVLLTNVDKNQCATTDECLAKGSAFAGTQCVDGVCVATVQETAKCTTNAQCLANPDTPNTYCGADGRCAPILNADCTSIITMDQKPIPADAVVLGIMAPMTGENATDGQACVQAATLAYQEFLQFAVGIPSGPGLRPRSAAMVVCDQMVDPERAATHLAVNVKVPAILGPGFSSAASLVAKKVAIPNGVLIMTPSATSPDLALLQDNGLVWRTSSSFHPEADAFADLVAQMEAASSVRTALGLNSTTPLRVAVLARGDSYGKGLAELLLTALRFNGTTAVGNGKNFARFDFPDLTVNPNADTNTIVNTIVTDFKPHILIAIGSVEVISKGLQVIEERWITGTGAQPRPYFLFSEGARMKELVSAVETSELYHSDRVLKSRVRVFGSRYNATLTTALSARYQAVFGAPLPSTYGVAGSYDAFYLVAYALSATQANPPTGASVAAGLQRVVPPGLRITAGPTDVSKALAELEAGRNIDYDGVVGGLDFDVNTGDPPSDFSIYCVQPTGFVLNSQYYTSATGELVGPYSDCP